MCRTDRFDVILREAHSGSKILIGGEETGHNGVRTDGSLGIARVADLQRSRLLCSHPVARHEGTLLGRLPVVQKLVLGGCAA
jgi:hypothetical protein